MIMVGMYSLLYNEGPDGIMERRSFPRLHKRFAIDMKHESNLFICCLNAITCCAVEYDCISLYVTVEKQRIDGSLSRVIVCCIRYKHPKGAGVLVCCVREIELVPASDNKR